MTLAIHQVWQDRITVSASSAASYRHARALPKPCFHPITTPRGHVITGFEMSDHLWHRGLWFAIKFINGDNFWEELAPFGVQESASEPACELISSTCARVTHRLEWRSDAAGVALHETRALVVNPGDATSDGVGVIDWTSELHATRDLLLDRTPYTTWGGYGGMTFRGSRELHDVNYLLPNGETVDEVIGRPHEWVVLQATMDAGHAQRVSIGMIDHPDNPRGPTPWYCRSGNGYTLMNAAFLFHAPMELAQGQSIRLRYRIAYRDGAWQAEEFARLADAFRQDH